MKVVTEVVYFSKCNQWFDYFNEVWQVGQSATTLPQQQQQQLRCGHCNLSLKPTGLQEAGGGVG